MSRRRARCFDGAPVRGPGAERGMVFQSYTLFPWLTVQQNICFGLREKRMPAAEQGEIAARFIAEVGLRGFENHYPKQLSGGMQQRVALARALANDPKILLLDEPLRRARQPDRALMQELLLSIWEQHRKTVLFDPRRRRGDLHGESLRGVQRAAGAHQERAGDRPPLPAPLTR